MIREAGYEGLIETLADTLRSLWAARGERTALSDHDAIGDVARDAFWAGGLLIRPGEGDGANIQVWEPGEVDPYDLGLTQHWREAAGCAGSGCSPGSDRPGDRGTTR